ncbi:hypothetical protein ACLOJK_003277 [Asimina triloba]
MASPSAGPTGSNVLKSYAQVVKNTTEHPMFKIPMRFPVDIDGEMSFVFSELEMTKAADEFRYAVGEKRKNEGRVNVNKIWHQKGIKEQMEGKTRTVMGENIFETRAVNGNPNENMAKVSVAHDLGHLNVTSPAEMVPKKKLDEVGITSLPDLINSVDMIQHREGKQVEGTEGGQHVQSAIPGDPDNSDEECEEVCHDDEPGLQRRAQADRVQTTVLEEEENNNRLGNGSPQGEVTKGYSSEREEGEITVLLGKEKMYDTDGERQSTAGKVTKSGAYEEKSVRKSQRFAKCGTDRMRHKA